MATVQYKTPREDAKDTERTQVGGKTRADEKTNQNTPCVRRKPGTHKRTITADDDRVSRVHTFHLSSRFLHLGNLRAQASKQTSGSNRRTTHS